MRSEPPTSIVPRGRLFVVTPEGHAAAWSSSSCKCAPRWVGLLLECPICGTIFGHYIDTPMSLRER